MILAPAIGAFVVLLSTTTYGELPQAVGFDHSHPTWAVVLERSLVVTGKTSRVRYRELTSSSETLNRYLRALSAVSEREFSEFSRNEQLSFLINSYNAFTVKLITEEYPVSSIRSIGGIFSSPWKREFIPLFGRVLSLDEIEHELVRPKFREPRIHFALVCAARSCPPLRREPYVPDKLDAQLTDAARNFLTDRANNRYDPQSHTLSVSRIFQWYGEDFGEAPRGFVRFMAPYVGNNPDEVHAITNNPLPRVEYLDYDWGLNEAPATLEVPVQPSAPAPPSRKAS